MPAVRRCRTWLSRLHLRFADHAMEAAYHRRRMADLRQISKLWCAVQFVLSVIWFVATGIKLRLFSLPTVGGLLPEFIPFLAIALVLLSNYVARLRPYTCVMLYMSSLVLLGFDAWKVHIYIVRDTFVAETVTLKGVYTALQHNTTLLGPLGAFINLEQSRKHLFFSGIRVLLQFNVLQFLGLDVGAAVVYLSLPVALFVTVYLSTVIANTMTEILIVACVLVVTALSCSFQVSRMERQRFQTDRDLQRMLEREVEMSQQLADHERRTREAAVEADNILNHMLKNIMADAAGLIWLYTAGMSDAVPADLQQALGCLDRGIQWCRRRQALVRISSGVYHLARIPVSLRAFGDALAQGRVLDCHFIDDVVLLDPLLCDILLDNAISNALRHGDTAREPVAFSMELLPLDEDEAELTFTVRNLARADKPCLTPEFVEAVLRGEVGSEPGNALSDHLGLEHLFLAAKAHDINLTLQQEGDVVLLQATLVVQLETRYEALSLTSPKSECDLEGLHILCLDDSEVARRLLQHTLGRNFPSCTVEVFGSDPQEVRGFTAAALDRGDVILIDNHLVYENVQFVGIQLLTELFSEGFSGFACVRSANMSPEDQAEYFASGAHCCLGKDVRPLEMVATLRTAYQEHRRSAPPPREAAGHSSELSVYPQRVPEVT